MNDRKKYVIQPTGNNEHISYPHWNGTLMLNEVREQFKEACSLEPRLKKKDIHYRLVNIELFNRAARAIVALEDSLKYLDATGQKIIQLRIDTLYTEFTNYFI